MNAEELFDKHDDEFLKFERIDDADRRHWRADICAFIYLSEKLPKRESCERSHSAEIVCSAEHDEIHLDCDAEQANGLTEDDVIYLNRCGVLLGEYGLYMLV